MSENFYYEISTVDGDPVFGEKNNVRIMESSNYRNQQLVYYKHIRYLVIDYNDEKFKKMRFKIGSYLFYHAPKKFDLGYFTTFFVGEYSDCENISSEFTNQIKKLVSYDMVEEWYPKSLDERLGLFINYFLDFQNHFGQTIELKFEEINYYLFIDTDLNAKDAREERDYILDYYQKSGYLKVIEKDDLSVKIIIMDKGIKDFQIIPKKSDNSKDAFIAIRFKDNERRIQAIEKAITNAGFNPRIMNEIETNNWIMPEIFYQIKKCKFMVADFSVRCDGAYYEAGYALALGKQVIHLCEKEVFDKNELHFDVAQKSTVLYSNYDELIDKLEKRIKATIQD